VVLLGASSLAISQVGSRILVAQSLGWGVVGFWQAVTRISDVYMQLISVLLISFVLPRLAAYKNFADMHLAFLRLSGALCGFFLVAAATIYVFRDILISLLFSRVFLPAADLLLPQLVGDFFRVIAVCLSVALLARGQTKMSMIYEASQGIIAYALTAVMLQHMTSIAPVLAYCFTYAILMLFLLYSYRSQFLKECGKLS
jgi:PST family polysaccharide transporter